MKERLLFLSAFLPSPNSAQAGQKTAYRNLLWLSKEYEVSLATFRNEIDRPADEKLLREVCVEVYIEPVTTAGRIAGLLRRPDLPLIVSARYTRSMSRRIAAFVEARSFARVHVEWSQMLVFQAQLGRKLPQTIYIHDVLTQWASRRAMHRGFPWGLEEKRCARWERWVYGQCHGIFVPSAKDGILLESLAPELRSRITIVPLQFGRYGPAVPGSPGPVKLLFWGALSRRENADGARWILREMIPRLQSKGVACRLTIAGAHPPADIEGQASPTVVVPGYVESPDTFFKDAHLAILPVFDGAGVKVKALECLAAGLPVLTTKIGAEGIEAGPEDGLIVLSGEPEAFFQEIARLAVDPAERQRLGEAALRWGNRQSQDFRSIVLNGAGSTQ